MNDSEIWFNATASLFGVANSQKSKRERESEGILIRMIRDAGGIPKEWVKRGTNLTGEQKRMVKNLVARGLLVEIEKRMDSGQRAKWIELSE